MFASAVAVLAAASPTVDAQVVDRAGRVVGPRTVAIPALRVRADGQSCRIGAGLPVGVLRALKVPFRAEGSCSSLYVFEAQRQRERGAGGWVYKVGRKLPGASASAPSTRLRSGQQVTWFWCVKAGACQRTLATRSTVSGTTLRTVVTAYDDRGRGVPAAGAQVAVQEGDAIVSSTTGSDGTATATVAPGRRYAVRATRRGLIPSFPEAIPVP